MEKPESDKHLSALSRREAIQACGGGALGVLLTGEMAMANQSTTTAQSIYEKLGVQPIINAAGTITMLGGSLMPPEVMEAWAAASKHFVNLLELQDRIGEKIASLLKVDAALVTTGAAGGILLGTAAALTYRDRSLVGRLPLSPDLGLEVIRQKAHRACYDNQVLACGVKLVDVETRAELERAISSRTVMMFSYNVHEPEGQIPQREWVDMARAKRIPTLLDAAADTPPLDTLHRYNAMGYDLVVFSGGKAIRGPQDAGLLLGRKDLVEAAKWNTSPHCGNIGRGLKVSKENMVAMWAAMKRFVNLDHDAERREFERRITMIEKTLAGIPTVETKRITPPVANHVPHLLIFWDETRCQLSREQMKQRLSEGRPSIATGRVHGTGDEGFLISVLTLQSGEDEIVAKRLREILTQN